MGERRYVSLSVEMGRRFMLSEQIWYDTDMCQSSLGLATPPVKSPSAEKIKYTLCQYALNEYNRYVEIFTADQLLERMWFTYGFIPCQFAFNDIPYRALVSIRGICWIDRVPASVVDPDGYNYPSLLTKVNGSRNNIREIINSL